MAGRRRPSSYRSTSYVPMLLMGGTTLIMLSLVGLGFAWFSGWLSRPNTKIDRTGQVACPALARPIHAFEAITRDDLLDPKTRQLNVIWVPEKTSDGILRDLGQILGRVVKRDKAVGMALTEKDFLPQGTRPGISAGIPPGKLAITIATDHIPGLEQLRNGDRFDLMISLEDKAHPASISNTEPAALFGGTKPPSLRSSQLSRQHGIKRLVTDGIMVTISQGTKQSTSGVNGLAVKPGEPKTKTVPTKFAEVAVSDEEVGPLTEAIGMGTKLVCVTRSGQPSDDRHVAFSIEGLVPVITTSRDVSAFTALTDENLIDDATGQLHLYYFPPDKVSPTWLTDPTELYGRVLARPKRRGAFITENDLLPAGSLPSVSAGLPPGMVAMALDPKLIQGMDKLQLGDHFSILTRIPADAAAPTSELSWATIYGGQLSPEAARQEQMLRTGIREVVHNAICMGAVQDPSSTPRDAREAKLVSNTNHSITIAVPEVDVVRVAQLLRDKAEVFVVTKGAGENNSMPSERQPRTELHRQRAPAAATPTAPSAAHAPQGYESRLTSTTESSAMNRAIDQADSDDSVALPVLVKPVKAFTRLTPQDFTDPATGKLRQLFFPRDQVDPNWIGDIRQLIDRVALQDLEAGRTISKLQLAPAGTLPGPSAGLPPGMVGLTVNSLQIQGLQTLPTSARFQLITAQSLPIERLADSARRSLASSDAIQEAAKLPMGRVPSSRVLAEVAVLVEKRGEIQVTIERRVGPTQTQRQNVKRIDGEGSIITETVIEDPTVQTSSQAATEYVIAVPQEIAGTVASMLDPTAPLQAVLSPQHVTNDATSRPSDPNNHSIHERSSASPRTALRPAGVDAVVIEHVRGTKISSELFLTDRKQLVDESSAWSDPSVRTGAR